MARPDRPMVTLPPVAELVGMPLPVPELPITMIILPNRPRSDRAAIVAQVVATPNPLFTLGQSLDLTP